jgi:hypothetical protein
MRRGEGGGAGNESGKAALSHKPLLTVSFSDCVVCNEQNED